MTSRLVRVCSFLQADLNRQGAWERLCLEKDPFILSGILWSWLEQLKEPIISAHDVHALHETSQDPTTVLNCLDRVRSRGIPCMILNGTNFMELIGIHSYYQLQASRETVRCILDCFAHLFTIPEEVESAFLERAAKAFTQVLCLILKMCLNAYMHNLIHFLLSSDEKHRWWEERLEACSAWFEVGRHERVWGVTQVTIPNWTPSLQREFIYISVHHQRKAPHISFSVTGEAWHRTEEQGHGRVSIKVFVCCSPLSSD